MNSTIIILRTVGALAASLASLSAQSPPPDGPPAPGAGGPGGPGGPMAMAERKLVSQFDKNGDGRLDLQERGAALEFLKQNPAPQRFGGPRGGGGRPGGFNGPGGPGGPGGPPGGGPRADEPPVSPGARISPADVKPVESRDLYATDTLRTLFLDFESPDWEAELEAFHGTDVELPATLTVDGKSYPGVGVHFRGMSSYMMVAAGHKRSLNVSLDFTEKRQQLGGYKTLNLLNSHEDGTFMTPVLFSQIARKYLPTPKANFVRVVINGENWGVYVSQEQFNKDFIQENFHTSKGARWKVRGSPMGRGGLDDAGDDLAEYQRRYEMQSGDDDDWKALVKLCKTLSHTPLEELEAALAPQLDLDGVLWFLALDCTLINGDGYWTRASDYTLYRDPEGRFHVVPGDMNETFRAAGGGPGFGPRGGGGRPPGGPAAPGGPDAAGTATAPPAAARPEGVKLDPLFGLDDPTKPLRSRLLAVPSLRTRYLEKVRTLANDLDWAKLGPLVAAHRQLIATEVAADTRKLSSLEEFERLTADSPPAAPAKPDEAAPAAEGRRRGPGGGQMPLRTFADQRRAYLLSLPAVSGAEK